MMDTRTVLGASHLSAQEMGRTRQEALSNLYELMFPIKGPTSHVT
jgi:hypothetical protein